MIFVTVGTTKFDELIQEVDRLVRQGVIKEKPTCQIGSGKYEPKHCDFFRFKPNIDEYLNRADFVITHGGTTVLSMLGQGKRFVSIANTSLADDHQTSYLEHISKYAPIHWSRDAGELKKLINAALTESPPEIAMPPLSKEIERVIMTSVTESLAK